MTNTARILLFLLGSTILANGQNFRAQFVKNEGQWKGDFTHKLRLNSGAVFFEKNGYSILLHNNTDLHHHDEASPKSKHNNQDILEGHVLKVKFLYANAFPEVVGQAPNSFYHNYFLGNDPSQWKSGVAVYNELDYTNLYPGIDLHFKGKQGNLKYDIHLAPNADARLIQMQYRGADQLSVQGNRLFIHTSVGTMQELIPEAYQIINGQKIKVSCNYILNDNIVKFNLGHYDPNHELIIDPELVFSSFSGSSADNFGFTATYDHDGNMYAGGIAYSFGNYPTTPGAFQDIFIGGRVDMGISKFSAIGDTLLYSTYIGGNGNDLPHSLVVNDQNELFILGNTSSPDYPTSTTAYQTGFAGGPYVETRLLNFTGSDIMVSKLSVDGTQMLASTYLGGPGIDGINTGIFYNYGDNSRGEIVYSEGRAYIISNSYSNYIPLNNAMHDSLIGNQDAIIACFSDDLSTLMWGTYFGGTDHDAGYAIKADLAGNIIVGGGTQSADIGVSPLAYQTSYQGSTDGYLALFNKKNGNFLASTYVGTGGRDQVFMLDLDKFNNLYLFGQTTGGMIISPGLYGNPGSRQFIKKLDAGLTTQQWNTTIGSGSAKNDIVPTAFLVDDCFNIYLSGWNGESNVIVTGGNAQGNTLNLPLTNDALQSSTDGSDFYFMVLGRNAESLVYATYYGGTAHEHVDGGTSRFDPAGTIYQAVCAGCGQGSFPVTPGVVSETNNSGNCNLGVIKFDFEATVRARPEIDFGLNVDTVCDTLFVQLSNESLNAQLYDWDFGNGRTSSEEAPSTFYENLGSYTIRLIATDTVCDISDTSYIALEHDSGVYINSSFQSHYIGCDTELKINFTNNSEGADLYQWDFGDGDFSQLQEPFHQFPDTGVYIVSLTAINQQCNLSETSYDTIFMQDTTLTPDPELDISLCSDGSVDILLNNDRKRFKYEWDFGNGDVVELRYPNYRYEEPGAYLVSVSIGDSVCNRAYSLEYPLVIKEIISEVFIPNAFTPNGDGLNEKMKVYGNRCEGSSEIRIFNRWGQEVFYSAEPFENFWDATLSDGKAAPMGIYTYLLKNGKEEYRGNITLIR